MSTEPTTRRVATNGIELVVDEAGPVDGPLVILLHGFPESRHGWRRQVGPLAEAGYRVVVPDQRGYGASDRPRGVLSYRVEALVDDVVGLISTIGRGPARVVGHDWGAIVAWAAMLLHPEKIERGVVLNGPHPVAMRRELRHNPRQLLKSWYAFGFQIPRLPEMSLRRNDFEPLAKGLRDTSRPGTFSDADLATYKKSWAEPGALTSMIHWYRAAFRHPPSLPEDPIVRVPTLMIWGPRDSFIIEGVARSSLALCAKGRLEWIEDATHWVHLEEPERVNRLILNFLDAGTR